jgi:hypothetical protein
MPLENAELTAENCSKWPDGPQTINKNGMEKALQQNNIFNHGAILCHLCEAQ